MDTTPQCQAWSRPKNDHIWGAPTKCRASAEYEVHSNYDTNFVRFLCVAHLDDRMTVSLQPRPLNYFYPLIRLADGACLPPPELPMAVPA